MCRIGDIILVENYIGHDGKIQRKHPFVVLNDQEGTIEGLSFDLTCSVMSSFKDESQKIKKLKYKENLEITVNDGVKKDGFIKADQLYYFKKDELHYIVIGTIAPELFNNLMNLIAELYDENKLVVNTCNL